MISVSPRSRERIRDSHPLRRIKSCDLLVALRIGVWGRGWDAWEHVCAGCCVVGKPRFDHGTLHHIGFLHAVIGVRVGVVGTCTVLQPILLETDAVQADPGKGGRVRATRARGGSELISARN